MAIQNFLSDIHVGDNIYIRLGDRLDDNNNVVGDFYIRHSGANTWLTNSTGTIILKNNADDKGIAFMADDGNGSATTYFELEADQSTYDTSNSVIEALYTTWKDNSRIALGTSRDLLIFHDGANSYINEVGTGFLTIQSDSQIRLGSITGTEKYARFYKDGQVELFYNNVIKLETTSAGIKLPSYGAGYLKTDANGNVSVDTSTIEDTLQTVTDRGSTTTNTMQGTRLGLGGVPHASAALQITTTAQHLRMYNGSELGVMHVLSSGELELWAHGEGETINFRTGSGSGDLAAHIDGTDTTFQGDVTVNQDLIVGNAAGSATTAAFGTFDQLRFDNSYNDTNRGPNKIVMHNNGGAWAGGFGVHTDTVAYYSGANHTFYKTTSQTASTELLKIESTGATFAGDAIFGGTSFEDNNSLSRKIEIAAASPVGLILNDTRDTHPMAITNDGAVMNLRYNTTAILSMDGASSAATFAGSITAGGDSGAVLSLRRDDTTTAADDRLGQIQFGSDDPSDGTFNYGAAIKGMAGVAWDTNSYPGYLIFQTRNTSGALATALTLDYQKNAQFTGTVTASSLIKSGGTSSQYLMADGSVSTSATDNTKLPLAGGTLTGDLHMQQTGDVYLKLESTDASTNEEVAIQFQNKPTGNNWWFTGLNQDDSYSLCYGTVFSGADTKFKLSTTGEATFEGNILMGNTVVNPASGFADQTGIGLKYSTTVPEVQISSDSTALQLNRTSTGAAGQIMSMRSAATVVHDFRTNYYSISAGAPYLSIEAKNANSFVDPYIEFVTWNVASGASSGKIALTNGAWNSNDMAFYTEGNNAVSEKMRILGGGNVGIGVDDPDAKLEIKGTGATTGLAFKTTDSSSNETFYIMDGGRVGLTYYPLTIGVASGTASHTAGDRLYIDGTSVDVSVASEGYLGIGVHPTTLLHLKGTGDAIRVESTNAGSAGAQVDLLHFTASPADNDINGLINFGGYYSGTNSAYSASIRGVWTDVSEKHGQLEFWTRDDSDWAQRLKIDHDGLATFAGNISSGDITIEDATPVLVLKDSNNGAGGAAEARILFSNTGGKAIGFGTMGNDTTSTDLYISSNASSTYGGYLLLDSDGISDAQADIIIDPKTNFKVFTAGTLALTLDTSQSATFAGSVHLDSDSAQLQFGDDNDMQIYHNGATGEINIATGDFTIDSAGDIALDADGGDIRLKDGSVGTFGAFTNTSSNFEIRSSISDKDIIFKGNDAGSVITALTLDMSEGGNATFEGDVTVDGGDFNLTKQNAAPVITMLHDGNNPSTNTLLHHLDFQVDYAGNHQSWGSIQHKTTGTDTRTQMIFNVKSQSGNVMDALTLTGGSGEPSATFAGNVTVGALTSGETAQLSINHEGGASPVATFLSRTNRAFIQVGDNDTNGYIVAEGDLLSIGRAASASDNNININASHNVGIGTNAPDTKLHVHKASAGAVSAASDAQLVVENSGVAAINLLSPATSHGQIIFGDPNDNDVGQFGYDHTDNLMYFKVNGGSTKVFKVNSTTATFDLSSVVITGDLQVNGTTTTVNQTNLDVSDNIIGLNRGLTGTNANDSGIIIERGSSGDNAAFVWDESIGYFSFGTTQKTPSATGAVANESDWAWKPIKASGAHFKTATDSGVSHGVIIERSNASDKGYINYQGGAFRMVATDGDPIKIGHVSNDNRLEITSGGDVKAAGQVEIKHNAGIYSFSHTVGTSASENIFELENTHGAQAFRATFVCNTSSYSVAKTFEVVHMHGNTPVFAKVVDTGAFGGHDFTVAFTSVSGANDKVRCTITNGSSSINANIVTTVFLGGSPTDITVTEL